MRVERNDVYFLLREVCKAAAELVGASDAMTPETSLVQTAHLRALQRSLDDLLRLGHAYRQDRP